MINNYNIDISNKKKMKKILLIKELKKDNIVNDIFVVKFKKPVEPYKGKGIRYVGEIVRRKQGKSVSK